MTCHNTNSISANLVPGQLAKFDLRVPLPVLGFSAVEQTAEPQKGKVVAKIRQDNLRQYIHLAKLTEPFVSVRLFRLQTRS